MQYKSYQHIEKIGREECEGILNGVVAIQQRLMEQIQLSF